MPRVIHPIFEYFVYNSEEDKSKCVVDDCDSILKGKHSANLTKHVIRKHGNLKKQLDEKLKNYLKKKNNYSKNKTFVCWCKNFSWRFPNGMFGNGRDRPNPARSASKFLASNSLRCACFEFGHWRCTGNRWFENFSCNLSSLGKTSKKTKYYEFVVQKGNEDANNRLWCTLELCA